MLQETLGRLRGNVNRAILMSARLGASENGPRSIKACAASEDPKGRKLTVAEIQKLIEEDPTGKHRLRADQNMEAAESGASSSAASNFGELPRLRQKLLGRSSYRCCGRTATAEVAELQTPQKFRQMI